MSLPQSIQDDLSSIASPDNLNVLVIGGTAGIGLGVTRLLSSMPAARITIAGRNVKSGKQICQEAPNRNIAYRALDASLMKNVRAFCASYSDALQSGGETSGQLHVLILSQGMISAKLESTIEGLERSSGLNYYSRMLVIRELLASRTLSPNAIIISVLNAQLGDTSGQSIMWEDMDLSRIASSYFALFSLKSILMHNFSMQDIMLQAFAAESNRTFIHSYPGVVKTNIIDHSDLPWLLKWIINKVTPGLSKYVTPEFSGEKMLIGASQCCKTKTSSKQNWFCIDDLGQEIHKNIAPQAVMARVKEHTFALFDRVLDT